MQSVLNKVTAFLLLATNFVGANEATIFKQCRLEKQSLVTFPSSKTEHELPICLRQTIQEPSTFSEILKDYVLRTLDLYEPELKQACPTGPTVSLQSTSLYDQIPSVTTVSEVIIKIHQAMSAPTRSTSPVKLKTRPAISFENSTRGPEHLRVVVQPMIHQPSLQSLFDKEHRQDLNAPSYQPSDFIANKIRPRVISQARDGSTTRESKDEESHILIAVSSLLVDFLFSLSYDILGLSSTESTSPDINPEPLMNHSIEKPTTTTAFKSSNPTEAEDIEPTRTQRHELSELEKDSYSEPTFASTTAGFAHG
jgi:hypothetical protein